MDKIEFSKSQSNVHKTNSKMISDEMLLEMANFYKVFGDFTRIKILYALFINELCVSELTEILALSQSAISHQLRYLRQNKLVRFRKEGKTVYYSLDDSHIKNVLEQGLSHILHD